MNPFETMALVGNENLANPPGTGPALKILPNKRLLQAFDAIRLESPRLVLFCLISLHTEGCLYFSSTLFPFQQWVVGLSFQ